MTSLLIAGFLMAGMPVSAVEFVYEPNGNLVCTPVQQLTGTDTDGDGTADCSDPDDDNDHLDDKYDIEVIAHGAHLDLDWDGDGIPDYLDMLPRTNTVFSLALQGTYEDKSDGECDVDFSSMDRYIEDFDTYTTGTSFDLTPPTGWSESTAPTDPGFGQQNLPTASEWLAANAGKSGAFKGSQDLRAWNGVNGITTLGSAAQAPQFHFSLALRDNDLFDDDAWIIISGASTTGVFKFALGAAAHVAPLVPNLADCMAQIKHTMSGNVIGEHMGGLLAHQRGDNLVSRSDAGQYVPSSVM